VELAYDTIPNSKPADIPSILPMLGKESLAKSKSNPKSSTSKKSYVQASKSSVEEVIHIKDAFLSLLTQKIIEISNIVNKSNPVKPKINMTTKRPSKKQIIVPMSETMLTLLNVILTSISTLSIGILKMPI